MFSNLDRSFEATDIDAYCKYSEQSVELRKVGGGECEWGLDTTQKGSKLLGICDQNPPHTSAAPSALTELLEIYQILKKTLKPSAQPVL